MNQIQETGTGEKKNERPLQAVDESSFNYEAVPT